MILQGAKEKRVIRLETEQKETNTRLGRIEETLQTSSRLFELMHERLEHLETGQRALVDGQQSLVAGQQLVVERLDRLVAASTRDRTEHLERIARLEERLNRVERQLEERD